jgi:hypothetical protein
VFRGLGIVNVPPKILKSVRKMIKIKNVYTFSVVFYGCFVRKPYTIVGVLSFEKG